MSNLSNAASTKPPAATPEPVSITPLLKRLAYPSAAEIRVSAEEIASAFALIFEDRLSIVQAAALLTLLHSTGKDREPAVIAKCAERMREAADSPDPSVMRELARNKKLKEGLYRGGMCDIVGTGGDSHSTFNISTTSSILASALLVMAKHGNRAQTSLSGSADILAAIQPLAPDIFAITAKTLETVYKETNYAFLFAPNFHPGMKHATPIRRGLGIRTIFNLLGPLANPCDRALEARLVGVAYQSLGPVFAEALQLSGAKKAMVVCGEEDLDEISCAGKTNCWRITEKANPKFHGDPNSSEDDYTSDEDAPPRNLSGLEEFQLQPSDFGLPSHPLNEVYSGKLPRENAALLMKILRNELPPDDPILDFVLMNTAALLVVAGVCDADTSNMGEGDDGKVIKTRGPGNGRWKEGVRRARWCIESGAALKELEKFGEVSRGLSTGDRA